MTDVLKELYQGSQNENISINSVFICMLHLANEKSLKFEGQQEKDFIVT